MVPYGDEQAYENSAASVIIMTGAIAIIAILEKNCRMLLFDILKNNYEGASI